MISSIEELREAKKILEECKKIHPKAVVSIASDLAVLTVNYIAEKLGLTSNNPENSKICTNKYICINGKNLFMKDKKQIIVFQQREKLEKIQQIIFFLNLLSKIINL